MADPLLLAVDVGNSRAKFGLFRCRPAAEARRALPECLRSMAVSSTIPPSATALEEQLGPFDGQLARAVIAGANPAGIARLLSGWPAAWPAPRQLESPADLSLTVRVGAPEKVGIDRLLNAVAANVIRDADQPAIIVDAGTATTVDFLSADGAFEGGAILPGVELGARALREYTALLPLIPVEELSSPPPAMPAKNTPDAMRAGLVLGQAGAIRELVDQLAAGVARAPLVLVTGGSGPSLAPLLKCPARIERCLSLQGLALAAECAP